MSSNLARERLVSMCLGPSWVAVMKGRLMLAWLSVLSSIFAFSAASVSRCSACTADARQQQLSQTCPTAGQTQHGGLHGCPLSRLCQPLKRLHRRQCSDLRLVASNTSLEEL